jgi:methionyl-tRNA formyltransferase
MSNLPIVPVPNKILKQKAQKVTSFGADLRTLAEDMLETMHANNGMGLAAPQVNRSERLIVLEYKPTEKGEKAIPAMILVNPKITGESKETDWIDEGCLSIPGTEVPVERPSEVNVLAQDLDGNRIKVRAKDLLARIVQHEIDHLDGVLMTERAYPRLKELAGLKVMFMGTPVHVLGYLSALASTDMEIVGVVTETDKPAGRKQKLTAPPVKQLAEFLGLPLFQFESLKDAAVQETIKFLKPDLVIVAAYGKIIPQVVLDIPKHGFLNVHYSLLPGLRGPSPHQTAILQGLKESGFTIFKLDKGIDTGPIVAQKKVKIKEDDTSHSLLERMAAESTATLLEILPDYVSGKKIARPQNHTKASTTKMFTKTDGLIDWTQPAQEIDRKIRAYQPWPIAYTEVNGQRLQIHLSHMEKDKLVIEVVQPASKPAMSFKEYLNGDRANRLTFFQSTGKVKLD